MNNGSSIIDAIIGEANSTAEANIAAAQARAEEIISAAQTRCNAELSAVNAGKKAVTDAIMNRKIMVANIDAKKRSLGVKMQLIEETFDSVPSAVRKDKRYQTFLKRLIEDNAENGDIVTIAKADASVIDKAFIDALNKNKNVKITLSHEYGDFIGGAIISNAGYDKNLTLESIIKQLRNELEMETAGVLFANK